MPGLFDEFRLKSVTLKNRIVVSPMCQYMAVDGVMNQWHRTHYESMARGGAGMVIVEGTGISPEGRISWADAGLWNDEQTEALKLVVSDMKRWGCVPGVQLAHAGRKGSSNRPWEGHDHIELGQENSWETISPSAIAFGKDSPRVPLEMTLDNIKDVQRDFVGSALRAKEAGIEWLQLQFAHGYLAQNFWSPHSNNRTDQYGGSAENRGRFLLETVKAIREVWPENLPLAARFGVVEFDGNDESKIQESIELLKQMKDAGLDSVDVSIGFNTPTAKIPWGPNILEDIAGKVLRETGLPGTTSWYIAGPKGADELIRTGKIDFATFGRLFLANPHWPYYAAKELGISDAAFKTLPVSYAHWLARYR